MQVKEYIVITPPIYLAGQGISYRVITEEGGISCIDRLLEFCLIGGFAVNSLRVFNTLLSNIRGIPNDYIKALRDDVVVMHDSRFLQEATVFVADGKGAYSAIDGAHDDHVIACLIGYQGCMDVGQYPTTYYDDTPYRLTWRDIAALGAPPPKPSALLGGIGVKTRKDQTQRSFVV